MMQEWATVAPPVDSAPARERNHGARPRFTPRAFARARAEPRSEATHAARVLRSIRAEPRSATTMHAARASPSVRAESAQRWLAAVLCEHRIPQASVVLFEHRIPQASVVLFEHRISQAP